METVVRPDASFPPPRAAAVLAEEPPRQAKRPRHAKALLALLCVLLIAGAFIVLAPRPAAAQFSQPTPPAEAVGGSKPGPVYPEPRDQAMRWLDLGLFAAALAAATWLILKQRRRLYVLGLLIASLLYFGFYRGGCVCPIGSIQNVFHSLLDLDKPVDQAYTVSLLVVAFFALPLALALFAGRIFCGGVCWLGAGQDLLLRLPLKIPRWVDKPLRYFRWLYLATVLYWVAGGLPWFNLSVKPRYLICEFDPFVNVFRSVDVSAAVAGQWTSVFQFVGPWWMWAVTGLVLLSCLFIGRPYCRWICPYGALLGVCSRAARRGVTVQPEDCCDCGLCSEACPMGAIEKNAAVNPVCLACARCYKSCPLERQRLGLPVPEHVVSTATVDAPAAPALAARTAAAAQRIIPAVPGEPEVDVSYVPELMNKYGNDSSVALPILQEIQARHRYLPGEAMKMACQLSELTMAQLTGLATFYNQFRLAPIGEHLVCVCHGTACHVAGADRVTDGLRLYLGIVGDQDTDRARQFTLQKVACLGCCSLAPCLQVDGVTFGHLRPDTAIKALTSVREGRVSADRVSHRVLTESDKQGLDHSSSGAGGLLP